MRALDRCSRGLPPTDAWRAAHCDEASPDRACRGIAHERDSLSGRVAARGLAPPVGWQAALIAAVHRCGAEGSREAAPLVGRGTFDGAWRWSWSVPDPRVACLEAVPPVGPRPEVGATVTLEILAGP